MHLFFCTLAYIIHILCGSTDVLKNKKAITEIISLVNSINNVLYSTSYLIVRRVIFMNSIFYHVTFIQDTTTTNDEFVIFTDMCLHLFNVGYRKC